MDSHLDRLPIHGSFISILLISAVLYGCSPSSQEIPLNPDLPIVEALQTPMTLSPGVWGGEQVTEVCLEVIQEFPGVEIPPVGKIEQFVTNTLKLNGIEVVSVGEACPAMLSIQLSSHSLTREYKLQHLGGVIGECHTGAVVTGSLTLSGTDQRTISKKLHAELLPPKNTSLCPTALTSPFYEYTWLQAVLQGLVEMWGPRAMLPALLLPDGLSGYQGPTVSIVNMMQNMDEQADIYIPSLLRGLDDPDPKVRWLAAGNLGWIARQPERVVPALIQALSDPEAIVREHAASSLRWFEGDAEPAIDALIAALGDQEPAVRYAAASALRRIGPSAKRAVPALIGLLDEQGPLIPYEAEEALKAITGQDLGREPRAWAKWYETNK